MRDSAALILVLCYCLFIGLAGLVLHWLFERKKPVQKSEEKRWQEQADQNEKSSNVVKGLLKDGCEFRIAGEVINFESKYFSEFEREVMALAGEMAKTSADREVTMEMYQKALAKVLFLRYAKYN